MKRETLAEISGVSLSSLIRFENKAEISLKSLLKIADALGVVEDFDLLFDLPDAKSIDELERREEKNRTAKKKRGRN